MPESLAPFMERHPIFKQAIADAGQLTWQQVGVPGLTAVSSLVIQLWNDYAAHRLELATSVKTVLFSLLLGMALYVLVAIIRAPFVVIGRQHRQLLSLNQRLTEIDFSPKPSPSLSPLPDPGKLLPSSVVATKVVEIEPNIIALESEIYIAHNDEDGVIVEGEIRHRSVGGGFWWADDNLLALTVPYRNRLYEEGEVGEVGDVSAQITYYSFDTKKWPYEINRVAWLSEEESYVSFGLNDTHRLVIVTAEGDKESHLYAVTRDFFGARKGRETRRMELLGDLFRVRISLLSESRNKVIKKSDYMLETRREPEFDIELTTTIAWQCSRLSTFMSEGIVLVERHDGGESEERLIGPAEEWNNRVCSFLVSHLGESYKLKFAVIPLTSESKIARGLRSSLLAPTTLAGKILAKMRVLESIFEEVSQQRATSQSK